MPQRTIKRALISVYDKTGIVDFARALHTEFGIEIISTGGTAKVLQEAGIPVTLVEDITGFPEMLDGRVKTLHPKIHAAILADRDNPEHMRQLEEQGIKPIDMVVVNLYPFEKVIADPNCTFEQAIEMIDIGGVALLRAAAKNHKHVLVEHKPESYEYVLELMRETTDGEAWIGNRYFGAAGSAIACTAMYDGDIMSWMTRSEKNQPPDLYPTKFMRLLDWGAIRYGENPHQSAQIVKNYEVTGGPDLSSCDCVYGIDDDQQVRLSFTNYLDADAAFRLCRDLHQARPDRAICVYVKHSNACGVAWDSDQTEAYRRAYLGDPNAAMGGILAVSFDPNKQFAENLLESLSLWGKAAGAGAYFLEVCVAPDFDYAAVEVLQQHKTWGPKVRLLQLGNECFEKHSSEYELRTIAGAMLFQQSDTIGLNEQQWQVVTKRRPNDKELEDLRLAWLIAKHTKSNAISICKDGMLIGNGAGQMSRVMSCRLATWLAKENGHADKLPGSVAASDAFFPFRDGPDLLIDAGVTAIIQPGGSKRDADTIAACDERGVAMIFTGTRHFRH